MSEKIKIIHLWLEQYKMYKFHECWITDSPGISMFWEKADKSSWSMAGQEWPSSGETFLCSHIVLEPGQTVYRALSWYCDQILLRLSHLAKLPRTAHLYKIRSDWSAAAWSKEAQMKRYLTCCWRRHGLTQADTETLGQSHGSGAEATGSSWLACLIGYQARRMTRNYVYSCSFSENDETSHIEWWFIDII